MRQFINTIWERTLIDGKSFISSDASKKFELAKTLVGVFYFLILWISIQSFGHFSQNPSWDELLASEDLFVPIWPMLWVQYVDWEIAHRSILLYFLISAIAACIFWKRYRLVRVFVALGMFMYVAQVSSFGKIDHYNHLMVLASFLFIFLPNIHNKKESDAVSFLQIFFGNQVLILLTYFSSGYYKFKGIYEQESWGMLSALSPESLAHNVAKTSLARGESYFFANDIFNHPGYHFSALLIGGYFIEFLSIYIIFKPQLHRLWGFVLILLHGMILLTVGPDFSIQIFVLGIFLLFSPFHLSENGIKDGWMHMWNTIKTVFKKKSSGISFQLFYNTNSALQSACIRLLNNAGAKHIQIENKESDLFQDFIISYSDLKEIKTIILIKKVDGKPDEVFIKAQALSVLFTALHFAYVGFKWLNAIAPFFADLAYDLAEKKGLNKTEKKL